MVSSLGNKELLAGWLGYLEEEQVARALVGTKAKLNIMQAVEAWDLQQREEFYCLECPLLGEAGVDFALQYSTAKFLQGEAFTGKLGEQYNRLFNLYSQKIGPEQHFYLELDTGFGDSNKLAIFMELPKADEQKQAEITRLALGAMGKLKLLKPVEALIKQAKALEPVMLGSMFSRLKAPVRICFGPKAPAPDKPGALQSFLKGLPHTENIIEDLQEIEQTEFLDSFLDVDLLPDGRLGPVLGVELMCRVHSLEQQHLMLESLQYHKFVSLLQKHALTDERIESLKRCCFYAPLPKTEPSEPEERLYSMISHFKLSYKEGKRLPAKVYLQGDRG